VSQNDAIWAVGAGSSDLIPARTRVGEKFCQQMNVNTHMKWHKCVEFSLSSDVRTAEISEQIEGTTWH